MKNLLAKKTIKILMGIFFSIFIFSIFNLSLALDGETVGTIKYYGSKSETYPCSNSTTGTCVMETRYYKNLNGYEVEQVIQKPNDGISGGKISEYYTDDGGQQWYKTGVVNSKNEITSFSTWNKGEKVEIKDNKSGGKLTYTLLQPLPTESGEPLSENVTLKQYLTWAYKFVLALTGFLAVMMIVIGGVEYIISGANESMRGEAHKRIWGAITGLVLALVAYLVLYTINPSLVNFEDNWFFKEKERTSSGSNSNDGNDNTDNKEKSYNDGTDYIEGTKNPLDKPKLDTSGIGDSISKEEGSNYNDGTDYIEGTENSLYKPKLEY